MPSSALALVPLLVPVITLIAVVLYIVIVLGYLVIVRPVIDWITKRGSGFLGGLIRWVVRPLAARADKIVRNHMAALARAAIAKAPMAVKVLDSFTDVITRTSGTIADEAEQTYRAFVQLRRVTVPALIQTALVPIRGQLDRHTTRLDQVEDLNRRTSVVIGTGLDSLPWGSPGTYVGNFTAWWNSYRHIWEQTFEHVVPRLNRIQFEIVPRLTNRIDELETRVTTIREEALPAIRQRIGRIEDAFGGLLADPTTWILGALGAAMLPVLAAGGMQTALRNLTCRNTQTVARNLCSMDEALLSQLLAGTLLFAIALDPRAIARAGQEVTGGMAGLFREIALR